MDSWKKQRKKKKEVQDALKGGGRKTGGRWDQSTLGKNGREKNRDDIMLLT